MGNCLSTSALKPNNPGQIDTGFGAGDDHVPVHSPPVVPGGT